MGSIRQSKIESAMQRTIAEFLQQNTLEICLNAMVSVTATRVTADLSIAKIYLSIFSIKEDKNKVLESINAHNSQIRFEVGKRLKNMHKIPELRFYIDDSLDYAMEIDKLLKKH